MAALALELILTALSLVRASTFGAPVNVYPFLQAIGERHGNYGPYFDVWLSGIVPLGSGAPQGCWGGHFSTGSDFLIEDKSSFVRFLILKPNAFFFQPAKPF